MIICIVFIPSVVTLYGLTMIRIQPSNFLRLYYGILHNLDVVYIVLQSSLGNVQKIKDET